MKHNIKYQTLESKRGEVNFRRKLAKQFMGQGQFYPGEPSAKEYLEIVRETLRNYRRYFEQLRQAGVELGPFLEIGAGVGQAGMLLCSEFGVKGFSSDLSAETIELSAEYRKRLGFKKTPIFISCDGYNLPFRSNSLALVFCFQTLHHLPDPKPVLEEVQRVLVPGGYFYFNNEPIAQRFNLNLWRRDLHLNWFEKVLKATIILHFLSRIGKSEVENQILEETFDLKVWERALDGFEDAEISLIAFPFGPKSIQLKRLRKGWLQPIWFKRIVLGIMGGGIGGWGQKKGQFKPTSVDKLFNLLACPNCRSKPKHKLEGQNLVCRICKTEYRPVNKVYRLFSKAQAQQLY